MPLKRDAWESREQDSGVLKVARHRIYKINTNVTGQE